MNKDTRKGIEVAANIAIILVAILVGAVLVKKHVISTPKTVSGPVTQGNPSVGADLRKRIASGSQIQPGTRVSFNGLDWAKNGKTLLLALSNKCRFCTDSAPFYQRIVKERGKARLVAILPQSIDEGKKYLESLNVEVDDIFQAPLTSAGVRSTPTLILVDKDGVAINSWVGKLAAEREQEVLNSLR